MKHLRKILWAVMLLAPYSLMAFTTEVADSVYLFAYGNRDEGRGGLHFAWSGDGQKWNAIGPEHAFVKSDYGAWGREKRMLNPFLLPLKEGGWQLIFSLNERDGAIASVWSPDLINWYRQTYTFITPEKNVLNLSASFDEKEKKYRVTWYSNSAKEEYLCAYTLDFKIFSKPTIIQEDRKTEHAVIFGKVEQGQQYRVPWSMIADLEKHQQATSYENTLFEETAASVAPRFKDLLPVKGIFKADINNTKQITDELIGIFFEDINYAADGGVYGELIQNRDFEWDGLRAWSLKGEGATLKLDSIHPIHKNNSHYAVLEIEKSGVIFTNEGWSGIPLKKGDKYILSAYLIQQEGKSTPIKIRLVDDSGRIVAETVLKSTPLKWQKQEVKLTANSSVDNARLEIVPQQEGVLAVDFVSLFPEKTYKNRRNGLRSDLAQMIADLKPQFVRFPGGCVAHGNGLDNIYKWKNTIGPLESRKQMRNIWRYNQSMGLGYYEYFQWCEDMGAEPLPVLAAGVPCQNSAHSHKYGQGGQMGGIPMCDMDEYVQDVLDLIEWANADPKTSKWAKMRAEAGHPKPFNLKYIGIGNEDLITDVFEERFEMIVKAVQAKYPEIEIIGTAGPFWFGSDYEEGWKIGKRMNISMLDEHYYNTPGWFVHNQDFYDKYDRKNPKVYLGEYAAHMKGRVSNVETALCEAIYLLSCERNGDVVRMTSYAPLLAKEKFTQWRPDLIYFNNTEVKPTVNYYVQKLFGNNTGNQYINCQFSVDNKRPDVYKRVSSSMVKDSKTGDLIIKFVNLLPVNAIVEGEITGLDDRYETTAVRTVLSGDPSSNNARPETSNTTVGEKLSETLSPYSLTVIRIPMKRKK